MHKFILISKALEVITIYANSKLDAYQQAREMGYEVWNTDNNLIGFMPVGLIFLFNPETVRK